VCAPFPPTKGDPLSTPETGAGGVPPCPPGLCGSPEIQPYLAAICTDMDWPPGHPVLIARPDGTICSCTCGAGAPPDAGAERVTVPPCSAEWCLELRPYLNQVCRDHGFPPGHRILVDNRDGTYCYCVCGGG
jgi:hypothetical protein